MIRLNGEIEMIAAIITFIIVIFAICLLFKVFGWSVNILFKLLLNAFLGCALLFIFNLLFAGLFNLYMFEIPITWFTALLTGVLGIPGVVLLLIFQLI